MNDAAPNHHQRRHLYWNTAALTGSQFLSYLFPFVTIPYLVRVLGPTMYGKVIFAQSACAYALIVADFGFNLYGTHLVAENAQDKEGLSECLSGILIIKAAALTLCLIVGSVCVSLTSTEPKDDWLFLASFGVITFQTLFPRWFFQGMERTKAIIVIDATTKGAAVAAIFLYIKGRENYVLVPSIYCAAAAIAALMSAIVLKSSYKISLVRVPWRRQLALIRVSSHYFLSRVSNDGLQATIAVLIGWRYGSTALGQYSMVERIYSGLCGLSTPLVAALYPYMIRRRDIPLIRKLLPIGFICVAFVATILALNRRWILTEMYHVYTALTSQLALVLFLTLPFSILAATIGYPVLGAFGYAKQTNFSLIAAASIAAAYIALVVITHGGAIYAMYGLAVYEMSCLAVRAAMVLKYSVLTATDYE